MCRAQVSLHISMLPVDMTLIHCTADNVSDDEESYNCKFLSSSPSRLISYVELAI